MRVVFWDKKRETYERVENVYQISMGRDRSGKYYVCCKDNGYEENYKCSRFEIERIEQEVGKEMKA